MQPWPRSSPTRKSHAWLASRAARKPPKPRRRRSRKSSSRAGNGSSAGTEEIEMHDLTAFPSVIRQWMESVPQELLTRQPAAGGFALVENAWHLADLEVEGYGVRLRRLLAERSPVLPDFQGD